MSPASTEVLTVHVAFHPDCAESTSHAREIFRLLHGAEADEPSAWSPIPVRYLCSAAVLKGWREDQTADPVGVHAVLVVMVSDAMLVDAGWRAQLNLLEDQDQDQRAILPVMISSSMSLLQPFAGRFDPLRVWHLDDGALPELPAAPRPAVDPFALLPGVEPARQQLALELRATEEAHKEEEKEAKDQRTKWMGRRFDRLRRGLLDALLRRLSAPRELEPALSEAEQAERRKLTKHSDRLVVFLSHAKADGDDIAQWLRDGLGRVSRLQTWYDQNDLRAGASADAPMRAAAASCSGGLIAVNSTAYATRPWCRKEAEAARSPVRCTLRHTNGQTSVLLVNQPGVAIARSSVGGWGRGVEALARLPTIGWPGPDPKPEELDAATARVVDRLLLELLQQRRFLLQVEAASPTQGEVYLAFTPDTWTLNAAQQALATLPDEQGVSTDTFVYPGGGLTTVDARAAAAALTSMRPGSKLVDLEHREQAVQPPNAANKWLALSAGGSSPELYAAGVGEEHINALAVALTRLAASMGWSLAYGGSLSAGIKDNHVRALLETARAWRQDEELKEECTKPRPRFVRNYVAVGHHAGSTVDVRASLLDLCTFILVDAPPQLRPAAERLSWAVKLDRAADPAAHLLRTCHALSEMRRVSTAETDARVLVGGKLKGWSGWLPGVAEELLFSIKDGQPALLLSGFGGVAGKLGAYLTSADGQWPEELTFAYHDSRRSSAPEDKAAWTATAREHQRGCFEELKLVMVKEQARIHMNLSKVTVCHKTDLRSAVAEVQCWLDLVPEGTVKAPGRQDNVLRDDQEA